VREKRPEPWKEKPQPRRVSGFRKTGSDAPSDNPKHPSRFVNVVLVDATGTGEAVEGQIQRLLNLLNARIFVLSHNTEKETRSLFGILRRVLDYL